MNSRRNPMLQVRKAFTLLETVISLTIMCALVSLSVYNLKDYQARVEEKQAIEWFKNSFKSTFNYCYLHNRTAIFYWLPQKNSIQFDILQPSGSEKNYRVLKLPKTLRVASNSAIHYAISQHGQGSMMSLKFHSELTHKNYAYKIQFGWGEIIEGKT